jgi:outer membrane receptor for ferric coprogen and ferric-rhodotorulic acid
MHLDPTRYRHLRLARSPLSLALLLSFGMAAEASADTDAETLDRIEVVGRSLSGTYYADEAEGARTQLPMRELPQSVRVLSRQALDDLGAVRLSDTFDYVGGISRQSNFGEVYENGEFRKMFQKRGFTDKERAAIKAALNL